MTDTILSLGALRAGQRLRGSVPGQVVTVVAVDPIDDGLVEQWREEPATKSDLRFEAFKHHMVDDAQGRNVFAEHDLLIVRMSQISRSPELMEQLSDVAWDVAVVDEAHRMSAHYSSWAGEVDPGARAAQAAFDFNEEERAMARRSEPHPVPGLESCPNTDLARLHEAALSREGPLLERVSALIEQTRSFVATQVNSALTLRNWHIGRLIDVEVLKEGRAGYDQEIVATLSPQLTKRFGRGFEKSSLYRMVKFSQMFTIEWALYPEQFDPTKPLDVVSCRILDSGTRSLAERVSTKLVREEQLITQVGAPSSRPMRNRPMPPVPPEPLWHRMPVRRLGPVQPTTCGPAARPRQRWVNSPVPNQSWRPCSAVSSDRSGSTPTATTATSATSPARSSAGWPAPVPSWKSPSTSRPSRKGASPSPRCVPSARMRGC